MASASTLAAKKPAPKAPAPAASPKPKSAAPATITLKAIFVEVAATQAVDKKQAEALLAAMVEAVTDHLKKGDRIRMAGLGILEVKQRQERMGRNPGSGEAIKIAASKKVAFRVAKELKDAV